MKKFLSLLLVCLMVVPFGMLAGVSVSADSAKTVYLSDAGDDAKDGTTAANAVKTMEKAYELLGTAGGTVVITGTFTQTANFKGTEHTGKITIKGADANAVYATTAAVRFILTGPTEFDALSIKLAQGKSFYILCLFNDITITETVTMETSGTTLLNLGAQAHAPEGWNDYTPKDTVANIYGGTWTEVIGMVRNGLTVSSAEDVKPQEAFKDVDLTINVDKNAKIGKMFAWVRSGAASAQFVAENATMTINLNGGAVTGFIGLHDIKSAAAGFGGGMTINIGKNFDLANSFNDTPSAGVFAGISGDSAWDVEGIVDLDTSKLVIADEKFDAYKADAKVRADSFASIVKASEATPSNPGTTPSNPGTGDATWVVAVVAAVAVMGCAVVTLKKRAN